MCNCNRFADLCTIESDLALDFLGGCGGDSADDAGPLASEPLEI